YAHASHTFLPSKYTHFFYSSILCPPPISPLFPYTTLFRSRNPVSPSRPSRPCSSIRHRRPVGNNWPPANRARSSRWRIELHGREDRKSTRLNSSHGSISYAVFCLKKKKL